MKLLTTLALFILISVQFYPQQYGVNYHAYSKTMVLSVEGASSLELSDYPGSRFDYLGKVSLEYFLPSFSKSSFGIRAFSGVGFISGKSSEINPDFFRSELTFVGGGIIYMLSLSKSVYPYFFGGASYLWFNPLGTNGVELPNNAAGNYEKKEVNFNGELGFRFLISNDLSFNINGGVHISPNDYLDDLKSGTTNDAFITIGGGFSYSFFAETDSDEDGVWDSKDICGDTPRGVKVDDFGCPVDTDRDGVPDYADECASTPFKVLVNEKGCPYDIDGDGVYDYLDMCANTPRGVDVDNLGCPKDSDKDGVADYLDKCDDTPPNIQVDEKGCPVDSDLDGVTDDRDNCPGTPAGEQVDEYGCPLKEEVKEVILSSGANFAFGSSELLPSAYPELDKLADYMRDNPSTIWKIEGHTDNKGAAAVNKRVSLQRAQAVFNYLVSKGISSSRFTVVGLGMDFPIADNSTEEGRSRNRRVAIIRLN